MIRFLGVAFTLVAVAASIADAPAENLTVVVHLDSGENATRTFAVVPGATVVVDDLELGDSVEAAEVQIVGGMRSHPALRLQMQFETSMTVMNDGPHLDLLDWKHFTSDWIDVPPIAEGRFRVPAVAADDRSRFPDVTPAEIREAVRAAGGERWSELIRDIASPLEYPASVDLSAIRLRVVFGPSADPARVFLLEFPVPMGC